MGNGKIKHDSDEAYFNAFLTCRRLHEEIARHEVQIKRKRALLDRYENILKEYNTIDK